eukprot:COSAG05_NODE_4581_length_1452_cov_1.598670_3_plen_60_part_00
MYNAPATRSDVSTFLQEVAEDTGPLLKAGGMLPTDAFRAFAAQRALPVAAIALVRQLYL